MHLEFVCFIQVLHLWKCPKILFDFYEVNVKVFFKLTLSITCLLILRTFLPMSTAEVDRTMCCPEKDAVSLIPEHLLSGDP